MFSFFKIPDVNHPQLGVLKWQRGCWRGEIAFGEYARVPLVLGGSRKGPDEDAIAHALALPQAYGAIRSRLENALFEHCEPYTEAVRLGELNPGDQQFPEVTNPEDALRKAHLEAALIISLDGAMAIELCYLVPWDEEHTVGARFRGEQWIELCGSTLIP